MYRTYQDETERNLRNAIAHKQFRLDGSGTRRLITGETWRFRYHIATMGRLPDAGRIAHDLAWLRAHPWGKAPELGEEIDIDKPLPEHGQFGYGIAYLEVCGDSVKLQRGDWDGAEETLCAECAEQSRPDVGSEWAYYPLLAVNGEIRGNAPGVFRCDRCSAIIDDAESIMLQVWHEIEMPEPDETLHFADDVEEAMQDAADYVTMFRAAPGAWYVRVLDAERHLDDYRTGESAPIETVLYADSTRDAIERQLASGQLPMATMPSYRPWEPEYWSGRPYPAPDGYREPTIIGSPEHLPEPSRNAWGFWD
jgi:hypothetical protein